MDSAAADPDPEVAATVRQLHRRHGWIWATVISVVAWLTAAGLLGSLAPDASGAGVAVGSIFVLLLTIVAIVSLAASVVDTVRLRRATQACASGPCSVPRTTQPGRTPTVTRRDPAPVRRAQLPGGCAPGGRVARRELPGLPGQEPRPVLTAERPPRPARPGGGDTGRNPGALAESASLGEIEAAIQGASAAGLPSGQQVLF
jgi:hypothetical protein